MANRVEFSREMGFSRAEFFRTLPAAMGQLDYTVQDDLIHSEHDGRKLSIQLGAEQARRMGLLNLPYMSVKFVFDGYSQSEQKEFMRYFDSRFQRGGG